ncbi:GNAT family N-acetyltransferase [Leuconostoc lactis]|uniref:GNAT family N-acetyltransferase n=2 Tax=Leuconostoc TaxID=1243 RepID=A0AAP9EDI8_LEULA|nr:MULTISPECIES: GNAT family protein [Leuconostoc]AQN80256.1 GNAT family acetyltransferase [Leuconostoc garlicum]QEA44852.1 GNAT family N-acetyltransferase [Leuconostoc lactis]GEB40789.1 N-acetyltransferase [Leuconostoc lactis]GHC20609.1 N-acetyltransferase [Leuconostoc lactis KCTC 3528 = DSM 20202]GLY45100.1 N-acetyltransferase [Leuconostoc lactis]
MRLKAQLAGFSTLQTERLILRPVQPDDAEAMFDYLRDEETVRFITVPPVKTVTEVIENSIQSYFMLDPIGKWAIVYDQKMIGTIDLRLNEAHRQAEIGYVLNKRYWGQGIMPEAAQAILAVGFDQLQLVRIFSEHDTRNPKSGRVMTKIGMQQEGVALKSQIIKGEIVDMVHYAITDTQYKMLQQAKKSQATL